MFKEPGFQVLQNRTSLSLQCLVSNQTQAESSYIKMKQCADTNGSFEIIVPYSTENTGSEVGAVSAYSLKAGGNITVTGIQVKESDVLNGNRLEVNIPET